MPGNGKRGIYLGLGDGGWAWSGPERSTLILGPSRSGKTSSIVIPNVLAADGAVVSTSTKPDVLMATARARARRGWTLLYDPSGTVEETSQALRVGWSPVNASRAWDGALGVAHAMVRATHSGGGSWTPATTDHWSERAAALLAPLLHAAALSGQSMRTVLSWVDRHEGTSALDVLTNKIGDRQPATDVLAGILTTEEREQSSIWSTASGVLAAYRSVSALASTEPPFLDTESFCSGPHTLYICAAGRHQQLFAPLIVGILSDVRDAAYRRALEATTNPPVLFALDEVANIAPLPDLPAIVSEGAGQGLLTLACLQDLSQARNRWGREAESFLSLFGSTMVLGGIADLPTLRTVSLLAGEAELLSRTVATAQGPDRRLHGSVSTSSIFRPRLPVDVVARGRSGMALAIDARNQIGWVQLTPSYAFSPWRELVSDREPVRSLDHALHPGGQSRETRAHWLERTDHR